MLYQPQKGYLIDDGEPIYLATTGKKLFKLSSWWQYQDSLGNNWVVPKSFISDLASVPSIIFWWQFGNYNVAAVAHDWIYIFGYLILVENGELKKIDYTKKEADRIFADINFTLGVSPIVNTAMYLAVRIFGRGIWTAKDKPEYGKTIEQLQLEFLS
ncbi:MAG: DUF1353 domain-containing protein [Prochloraceae cyanobacterium]|nr:DUF1353 domain-containing protein [Prochloraceae cyanobacterium]